MHEYLRAIGFSKIKNRKELEEILNQVEHHSTDRYTATKEDGTNLMEFSREYGDGIGIVVRGEKGEDNSFIRDYYFPYFLGNGIPIEDKATVVKYAEKDIYVGLVLDNNDTMTIIFYLQNALEYIRSHSGRYKEIDQHAEVATCYSSISGLSIEGKILMPIQTTKVLSNAESDPLLDKASLIQAARDGDQKAIERLTLDELDTYSSISRRIETEDLYSIVSSNFMPYGIESDQYAILGEIKAMKLEKNTITDELIYILTIETNGMLFETCINKQDLLGEPAVGRRFKGIIWLQGTIEELNS